MELAHIALVIDEYDTAIAYYTQTLGFELLEDTQMSEIKRWVMVRPPGSKGCSILLARAVGPEQISRIGNQTGGRVFLFLYTDNIQRDYDLYLTRGVEFVRPLISEPYGTVTVFKDHYGNLWDLIQPVQGL